MVVLQPVSVDCPMVIVWRRLCLGGKEFFILFDRDFKEIKRFGNHPVRGMTTEANDFMQLQGEMVSYKNSFYFASRFLVIFVGMIYRMRKMLLEVGKNGLVEPVCQCL